MTRGVGAVMRRDCDFYKELREIARTQMSVERVPVGEHESRLSEVRRSESRALAGQQAFDALSPVYMLLCSSWINLASSRHLSAADFI